MKQGLGLSMAFRTLTRFPFPQGGEEKQNRSLFWFPLVGLVLGCFSVGIALLPLPDLVCSTLIVIASAYITRGFHLDGLCDVADGFGGGWTKEATLRIMRDSSIGAFGLITLVCTLLFQVVVIASLLKNLTLLLFVPALGRTMTVLAACFLPYAREGEGTASRLVRESKKRHILGPAAQIALFLGLLWIWERPSFFAASLATLFAVGGSLALMRMSYRRIGGITGDVLGAIEVLAESFAYFGVLLLFSIQGYLSL